MKKTDVIEFWVSLLCIAVALFLSIHYSEKTTVAIISAVTAIVSTQNLTNILRDSKNVNHIDSNVENNISSAGDDLKTLINETNRCIASTGDGIKSLIEVANKRIPIDELETKEREFCHKEKNKATIYVVSNNLTMDKTHFLDEMTDNIKNGVSYIYVVNQKSMDAANKLRRALDEALNSKKRNEENKINISEKMKIYEIDAGFCFAPSKYTLVIYDNGLAEISRDESTGYCCAQDGTQDGIYYFQMSHKNLLEIKERIDNLIGIKNVKNVEQEVANEDGLC